MANVIDVKYQSTGKSLNIDKLGMREMQRKAYQKRNEKYVLIKAPPASGKSRALMFIGLDKLINQGLKKVIVSVPERTIGKSFQKTQLKNNGFYADWDFNDKYDLCTPGDEGKTKLFRDFLTDETANILVCTHSTFRRSYNLLSPESFNNTLVAIDEFHHVSVDEANKLGRVLNGLMKKSNAHIVAMTGSYFRGDSIAVLLPEDEALFKIVTYNYYDQLNGYKYLKSLGIGYHFYQGEYTQAIEEVLDTNKKTIIHIPHTISGESLKNKSKEVDSILDVIGEYQNRDEKTGLLNIKRKDDGKIIKVADLVSDTKEREITLNFLRKMSKLDDVDIIIAMAMAIEGFDWPYCEHALTVGHRASLTQIIQIIGRATRDSENKNHSQFTNLIIEPDAESNEVIISVNTMLKAISASLLMEQVLAPNVNFKSSKSEKNNEDDIVVKGYKKPSKKVQEIIDTNLNDLKANMLQDTNILKAMTGAVSPEVLNKVMIPEFLQKQHPDLTSDENEQLRQYFILNTQIKSGQVKEKNNTKIISVANQFYNLDELSIDLIDAINPFQKAYEVTSKHINSNLLKAISNIMNMQSNRIKMSDGEAILLWKEKIPIFQKENGRLPDINSVDEEEKRMAEAIEYLKRKKREYLNNKNN